MGKFVGSVKNNSEKADMIFHPLTHWNMLSKVGENPCWFQVFLFKSLLNKSSLSRSKKAFANFLVENIFRIFYIFQSWHQIKYLTNDKILDWSRAFINIQYMGPKQNLIFGRLENIVGKGENAWYQHFLLFLQCFPNLFSLWSFQLGILWNNLLQS